MIKHTSTPWKLHKGQDYIVILRPDDITDSGIRVDNYPDAAFIVKAVNLHDDMVAALEALFKHCAMIHKHWGDGSNQKEADAAIKAATAILKKAKKVKP